MKVDGFDLAQIGFVPTDRGNARAAPDAVQKLLEISGAARRLRIGQEALAPRIISVIGALTADTLSQLQSRMDELKWRLREGKLLQVEFTDQAGRVYEGYRERLVLPDIPPGWKNSTVRLDLAILCPDPRARDATETVKSGSGGVLPAVLTTDIGTARLGPRIVINGPAAGSGVNPKLEYRDKNDVVKASFTWAGTLNPGDQLVVDLEAFTVKKNGADAESGFTGDFFELDADDADFPTGTWPDVQLSLGAGGSGTFGTWEVRYFRRWE